MRILGFMSGTSLDGVDAALLETDGERLIAFGPARAVSYTAAQRRVLEAAVAMALSDRFPPFEPKAFADAEAVILETHLKLGREISEQSGPVDLIGFHGQTVLHRPDQHLTLQIGRPQALADGLQIPVVGDLRIRDMQEGGQGAPIVPIYHAALAELRGLEKPVAFLNIGGVSNITWIGPDNALEAFDVGPGNGLIDQWVAAHGLGSCDTDGRLAGLGIAHADVIRRMMEHPFFGLTGPRSLDRYDFNLDAVQSLSAEDGAATLTAFTAEAVAHAVQALPEAPRTWVLCGGGRHNKTLGHELDRRLGGCHLAEDFGFRGDFVEAEAIAFLAARSVRGLPITFPGTTGTPRPTTGGKLYRPAPAP
ncbi:MAG TPA: anhydro-N-acetylmuramic acid kinase [Rhizomicrobium sp.]|nr:anhydro-N-acetylmuramic acid kinase [Rhizomicrobium sp.]